MRRLIKLLLALILMATSITGCYQNQAQEVGEMNYLQGNVLNGIHEVEEFQIATTYETEGYELGTWKVTDYKTINMSLETVNIPQNAIVLIQKVSMKLSLKSHNYILEKSVQQTIEDIFFSSTQDGYLVNQEYNYQKQFEIINFSKELIERWELACNTSPMTQCQLKEENLIKHGQVYANELQVTVDMLVKYEDEEYFHKATVVDEFLIPVGNH